MDLPHESPMVNAKTIAAARAQAKEQTGHDVLMIERLVKDAGYELHPREHRLLS
jgi:hypothetical protein